MSSKHGPRSPLGHVTVTELESTPLESRRGQTAIVDRQRYQWQPSARLQTELPHGFELSFDCFCTARGERCFSPADGCEDFLHRAAVAGLAGLTQDHNLGADHRQSYRTMFYVFQLVRKMQPYLYRKFESARDFYVRPTGRGAGITHSLLPADLGLDSDGQGRRWRISELMQRGRELAQEEGIRHPTSKIAIEFGLLAAARLRPLRVAEASILPLVRTSLFDLDSIDDPSPSLLETVTERLAAFIFPRKDENRDQFEKKFFPGKSNLIKALADQPQKPGGKLPHDKVRQAVLHLGWQSFFHLSSAIQAFCQAFLEALPTPLTPDERRLFDGMYMPQPYFGGLPLLLLKERGGIIKPVMADLWDDPQNAQHIGVLHRLLAIYAEIATNRRTADRRFKRKSDEESVTPREISNMLMEIKSQKRHTSTFSGNIAMRLADERGFECDVCDGWNIVVVSSQSDVDLNKGTCELELNCECGRISKSLEIRLPPPPRKPR